MRLLVCWRLASSVQSSHLIVSNSLDPMDCSMPGLPVLPTPGACSNSCPSSWWCHPTISFSVIPFSSCPQSFPASRSFPMSQVFTSGGQSIGASASASILPMNTQHWSPLEWTGWISLQSKGLTLPHRLYRLITLCPVSFLKRSYEVSSYDSSSFIFYFLKCYGLLLILSKYYLFIFHF